MDSDTSVYSDDLPWSDDTKPSLTFAALWDPDEGMITFSGARLLETDATSLYTDTTSSFSDPPTEHVAPLSPLHGFRTFLYRVPSRSLRYREPRLTRTSSVVDAKDAPRRELRPSRSLHIPRQGFRADRTPQVERGVDEHSVTPKRGYLTSRLSTATTSTTVSRTVHLRASPPALDKDKCPSSPLPSPLRTPRRRLRKRRPDSKGVGTDRGTRSELPKTSSQARNPFFLLRSPSRRISAGFPRRMASLRRTASAEGWVWIEVQTCIQQLYVPDPADD